MTPSKCGIKNNKAVPFLDSESIFYLVIVILYIDTIFYLAAGNKEPQCEVYFIQRKSFYLKLQLNKLSETWTISMACSGYGTESAASFSK